LALESISFTIEQMLRPTICVLITQEQNRVVCGNV
jgi:hypothetical protein